MSFFSNQIDLGQLINLAGIVITVYGSYRAMSAKVTTEVAGLKDAVTKLHVDMKDMRDVLLRHERELGRLEGKAGISPGLAP